MKLFSIIIPTYKGEDSLPIALQSIVKQSYSNIEVIVSDDNGKGDESQIKTEKVINEFKNKLNITYLVNEHVNGSHARNEGLKVAKGEYVSLLDDDDFYLQDYVKDAVDTFENNDTDLVFFNVVIINKTGVNRIIKNDKITALDLLFYRTEIGTGSNICFRRDIYKEDGGFDERYLRQQDIEFAVKKLNKYKALWIDKVEIVKYFNKTDNYPNFKRSLDTYELLRNDLLDKKVIDAKIANELKIKQLHNIYNDMLVRNADKETIKDIYNELKTSNSLSFIDKSMMAVYGVSKSLFNSIFKSYMSLKSKDNNNYQEYLDYYIELGKY